MASLAFQFTYPGIPALFYGDEIGLTGGKDPDCRKSMRWNEAEQDRIILNTVQQLTKLRRESQALQDGRYHDLSMGDEIFSFVRSGKTEQVLACFNMTNECHLLKAHPEWESGWEPLYAVGCSLSGLNYPEIPPHGVRIFKRGK